MKLSRIIEGNLSNNVEFQEIQTTNNWFNVFLRNIKAALTGHANNAGRGNYFSFTRYIFCHPEYCWGRLYGVKRFKQCTYVDLDLNNWVTMLTEIFDEHGLHLFYFSANFEYFLKIHNIPEIFSLLYIVAF